MVGSGAGSGFMTRSGIVDVTVGMIWLVVFAFVYAVKVLGLMLSLWYTVELVVGDTLSTAENMGRSISESDRDVSDHCRPLYIHGDGFQYIWFVHDARRE
jgi:hypothetical protein